MAIDKALYQAPQGLDTLMEDPQLEIEVIPETEVTEMEVNLGPVAPNMDDSLTTTWLST
jgi:hypothetical protein